MSLNLFLNTDVLEGSVFARPVFKFFERLSIEFNALQTQAARSSGIGSYLEAYAAFASVTGWATNVPKTVLALPLTQGRWMVVGEGVFGGGAITGTDSLYQLSKTAGSFDTIGGIDPGISETSLVPTAGANIQLPLAARQFVSTVANPATAYLVGRITFTAGTPTAGGSLRAWRTG